MSKYDIARKELEMFFAVVGDDMAAQISAGQAMGKHAHQLCSRSYLAWQSIARAESYLAHVSPARRTRLHYEKLAAVLLDIEESLGR